MSRKHHVIAGGIDPDSDNEGFLNSNHPTTMVSSIHLKSSTRAPKHPEKTGHKASGIHLKPPIHTRKRPIIAGCIDPDSDDDVDLDVCAISHPSGKTTVTYRAFPSEKKPRLEHPPSVPPQASPNTPDSPCDNFEPGKRNQVSIPFLHGSVC